MGKKLLPLKNFDKMFHDNDDASIIPYGVETRTSEKQAEEFMKLLFKEGDESIEFVASCDCGALAGNYYMNSTCPDCRQLVKSPFTGELKFKAWLEIPDYVPPIMQPAAYRTLKKWMGTHNGSSLLDQFLDVTSELPEVLATNVGCGFKNFHDNFDKIIQYLLHEYKPFQRKPMRVRGQDIPKFIELYRDEIFIRHIPVLNENLHIINRSGSLTYTDESSTYIMKTLVELSHLAYAYATSSRTEVYLEQNMKVMYDSYISYVDSIIKSKITQKKGFIRKCILGTKVHFSFRGVIVPTTASIYADELEMPWRVGVIGNKLEIINFLTKRNNKSLVQALGIWHRALAEFDQEVYDILLALIDECPYKGLPVTFGRNPTMNHGSIQLLFVTRIKKDLDDNTIGFSPLILASPNADYDGKCVAV